MLFVDIHVHVLCAWSIKLYFKKLFILRADMPFNLGDTEKYYMCIVKTRITYIVTDGAYRVCMSSFQFPFTLLSQDMLKSWYTNMMMVHTVRSANLRVYVAAWHRMKSQRKAEVPGM